MMLGTQPLVYDIQVENEPEFFVNGVLVHNCPLCSRQDGRIFVINSLVGIALLGLPPDGTHMGCRCTVIPLMLPVDDANAPPEDTFDDWLDEYGFADELDFFMQDETLESTQL